MIAIKGNDAIEPSNRSIKPPCPGIRIPESFTLALLLIKLKTTSPIKLIGVITIPRIIAPYSFISRKLETRTKKTGVKIMAPISPSNVFPGLVFLRSILLPNFFPKKYATESAKETAIRTGLCKILSTKYSRFI